MSALTDYRAHLEFMDSGLESLDQGLKAADKYLGKLKKAVSEAEKAAKEAKDLDKFVTNMEKAVKVLKLFGPTKFVATGVQKIIDKVQDGTLKLEQATEEVKDALFPYKLAFNAMSIEVKIVRQSLANDLAQTDAIENSVDDTIEAFEDAAGNVPAAFASLEGQLEVYLAGYNNDFSGAELTDALANLATMNNALEQAAEVLNVLEDVLSGLRAVYGKVDNLEAPLDIIGKALAPFDWLLSKAEWLLSKTLDPILDPIFEATGINSLMDKIASAVTSLLPKVSIFNPFDNLSVELNGIFGVEGPDGWTLPMLTDVTDQIDAFREAVFGTADFLAPLRQDGEGGGDGFDFIAAYNRGGVLDTTHSGGEGGDIIAGGIGDDTLFGDGGDDLLIGGGGSDSLVGGAGFQDMAFFSGTLLDYALEEVSASKTTITYVGSSTALSGVDTLEGVEYVSLGGTFYVLADLLNAEQIDYIVDGQYKAGTAGDDILLGDFESDTLEGLGGNDQLVGFGKQDELNGGTGRDLVNYAAEALGSGVTVVLDPTLIGVLDQRSDIIEEVEDIIGTSHGDIIAGGAQASRFVGGAGDDKMFGGAWNDTLKGGAGSDTLVGGDGNDLIDAKGGDASDNDLVVAGTGNDTVEGSGGTEVTYSDQPGLAALVPYAVDLLADLPIRIEVAREANGVILVNKFFSGGGTGQDEISGISTLVATASADLIRLSNRPIDYYASAGDDVIRGWYPNNVSPTATIYAAMIDGGTGDDQISTWTGDEHMIGGDGDDTFKIFNKLDDDLSPDEETGPRQRLLIGGGLEGYDPDLSADDYSVGVGDLAGTEGYDILDLSQSDLLFAADLGQNYLRSFRSESDAEGRDLELAQDAWVTSGIDEIIGSDQRDFIVGSGQALKFTAGGGDDVLRMSFGAGDVNAFGGDGDDLLESGFGVDTLAGGNGSDSLDGSGNYVGATEYMYGGDGDDEFRVRVFDTDGGIFDVYGGAGRDYAILASNEDVTVDLGADAYSIAGRFGVLADVEHVFAGGNASVTGDGDGNFLRTSHGDDNISGGFGADIISSGEGDDTVFGGGGDDMINPGTGGGLVVGGEGDDRLRFDFQIFSLEGTGVSLYEAVSFNPYDDWVIDFQNEIAYQFADPETILNFTQIEGASGSEGDDLLIGAEIEQPGFWFSGINLNGADGEDTLYGSDKADTLLGGEGNDTFFGGGGDDDIHIGRGAHFVDGGEGLDSLWLEDTASQAVVNMNVGYVAAYHEYSVGLFDRTPEDPFEWQSARVTSIEKMTLTSGDDYYEGGGGNETVYGGDGDDYITGGGGLDVLDGGAGNDKLIGNAAGKANGWISINESSTNDYLFNADFAMPTNSIRVEIEVISERTDAASCLMSYGVTNSTNEFTIFTDAGADRNVRLIINGLVYDTQIRAEEIYDGTPHRLGVEWSGDEGYVEVYLDGVLMERAEADDVEAGFFDPITTGGYLAFGQDQDGTTPGVISSFDPNQIFSGKIGDIRISEAFDEPDTFALYAARDLPSDLQDQLIGDWKVNESGTELLSGGPEGLSASGVTYLPTFAEPEGWNRIFGGEGDDTITGAFGNDTIYGNAGSDLIFGGAGSDDIFGGGNADTIWGGDGNDSIGGGGGADEVWGGSGNDTVYASAGYDTVNGGSGDDVIFTGDGIDAVFGNDGDDKIGGVGGDDIVNGGVGNDTMFGAAGNDLLTGDVGQDLIYAGTGNDTVYAGGWNDTVFGAAGNDLIYLGNGNDRVDAGPGTDVVFGGSGLDVFVFRDGHDNLDVEDFSKSDDRLELEADLWGGGLTATQVVAQFADDSGSDVVFTFGDDVLTLTGVDTTTSLDTLIDIV